MKPTVSTGDALRFGWTTLKSHVGPLLMLGGASAMLSLISQSLSRSGGLGGAVLSIAVQMLHAAVGLALVRAALRLFDGEPVDLTVPAPLLQGYWGFLLTSFVYGLLVSVGLVFLVVPGVLLGLAFLFAPLFTASGQRDPIEAFRESSRLTRGARGQLFVLLLALAGVNFCGLLLLGFGLVVTVPWSALALVYAFRHLQGRHEAVPPAPRTLEPRAV